jgi:hypothetical protein
MKFTLIIIIFILISCSVGSNTYNYNYCSSDHPLYTESIALSLINGWGDGLQKYAESEPTVYNTAVNFTVSYYQPDSVLLGTLFSGESDAVRYGTQRIYEYFAEFLTKYPQMTLETYNVNPLGCGAGASSGLYSFTLNQGKPTQSVIHARYTFLFEYIPRDVTEYVKIIGGDESGKTVVKISKKGWYINTLHSTKVSNLLGS